jgi:hypothetical protein
MPDFDSDYTLTDWHLEQQERAAIREEGNATNPNGHTTGRFRLLSDEDIENQPPRVDLVADIVPAGAFGVLIGPPATLKTTLALDFAFSIDTGPTWHGRTVLTGPVVYIAAEGVGGLGLRLRAWKHHHAWSGSTGVVFLPHAVNMMNPRDVELFLRAVDTLPEPPLLVIADTLARCLIGGEENSARDMGLWIAGADRIRSVTGAAVLAVHHTAKNASYERGSSALRGAADTILLVEREDDRITLTCDKQKDGAPFSPIRLAVQVVDLGDNASACVLTLDESNAGFGHRPFVLPASRSRVLDALRDIDHGEGAAAGEWQRASGLPERSFHRALKDLLRWELIDKTGKRRPFRYVVRERGNE